MLPAPSSQPFSSFLAVNLYQNQEKNRSKYSWTFQFNDFLNFKFISSFERIDFFIVRGISDIIEVDQNEGQRIFKNPFGSLKITICNLLAFLTLRLIQQWDFQKLFLMQTEKLKRSILFPHVLVWCETHLAWKIFYSLNVCTLKDHILNLDWQLCQTSWQLYKKKL